MRLQMVRPGEPVCLRHTDALNPGLAIHPPRAGGFKMVVPDPIAAPALNVTSPPKWKRKVSKVTKQAMRFAVYERDHYRCVGCGWMPHVPDGYDGRNCLTGPDGTMRKDGYPKWRYLELDHVVPFSKGGLFTLDNLQAMCHVCNIRKGNKL